LAWSFTRAGENLTGVAYFNVEVAAKRLELLHKLVPEAKSIALLVQRGKPQSGTLGGRSLCWMWRS
jgi:ABC-type uncharacterized transport system substrate-binding protein